MSSYRTLSIVLLHAAVALGATASLAGCETEDPTHAVVENTYVDGVVYKAWWVTTLFDQPVPPSSTSVEQRSVPDTGFAYALLAPGWDPASGTTPTSLIAVKSKAPLTAERGSTLRIRISDAAFEGQCSAKQPLTQADADLITQRIFVADFTNVRYNAANCTTTVIAVDAGDGL